MSLFKARTLAVFVVLYFSVLSSVPVRALSGMVSSGQTISGNADSTGDSSPSVNIRDYVPTSDGQGHEYVGQTDDSPSSASPSSSSSLKSEGSFPLALSSQSTSPSVPAPSSLVFHPGSSPSRRILADLQGFPPSNTTSTATARDLIVSEAYYDGTSERVEITNVGGVAFSGMVQLSDISTTISSGFLLELVPGQSKIIADASSPSGVVDTSMVLGLSTASILPTRFGNSGLVLNDTQAMSIRLLVSGLVIDTLALDVSIISQYGDAMTSVEKVRYNGARETTMTSLDRKSNAIGITANPGSVYARAGNHTVTFTQTIACSYPPRRDDVLRFQSLILTGATGLDSVAMIFDRDYIGAIQLVADGVSMYSDTVSVVSGQTVTRVGDLSTGTLRLYASGELNDTTFPTIVQIPVIQTITNTVTNTVYVGGGGGSCPPLPPTPVCPASTGALATGAVSTGTVFTGTTVSGTIASGTTASGNISSTILPLTLTLIDYDPPGSDTDRERVGLRLFDPLSTSVMTTANRYVNIAGRRVRLGVGTIGAQQTIFTGNYAMPNSTPTCILIQSGTQTMAQGCYDPTVIPLTGQISTGTTSTGLIVIGVVSTGTTSTGAVTGQIVTGVSTQALVRITAVDYDPAGVDEGRESVSLLLYSGAETVDLSPRRLRYGTTTKKLSGTLMSGQIQTFFATYGFPNTKNTCVDLLDIDRLVDTYCYTIPLPPVPTPTPPVSSQTDRQIRIRSLLADPEGSDAGREEVVLELLAGQSVDLSRLSLRRGSTSKKLRGTLVDTQLLRGTFTFPNSVKTCVDLVEGEYVFDTYCYEPLASAPKTPPKTTQKTGADAQSGIAMIVPVSLRIMGIDYDPEGVDKGSETIQLILISGASSIDLRDDYRIRIGKKTVKLDQYGTLIRGQIYELQGTFGFPNGTGTCVDLIRQSQIFDTYCYTIPPKQSKSTKGSGAITLPRTRNLQITAVRADPVGADADREWIELVLTHTTGLRLDKDFRLRRKTAAGTLVSKTMPDTVLVPGATTRLTKSRGLPNSSTCLELTYAGEVVDTYCYRIFAGKKTATTKKVSKRVLGSKDLELRLLRAYRNSLEQTLIRDRPLVWYRSDLVRWSSLYRQSVAALDDGRSTVTIDDVDIPLYDLDQQYKYRYSLTPHEELVYEMQHRW